MTDAQSLVFYITSFLLASFFMYLGYTRKFKLLIVLSLAIPIIIGGLRYNVGTDYPAYVNNMSWLADIPIAVYLSDFSSFLEPTFFIFTQVAYFFNFPHLLFFIYSTITIIFLYKALKASGMKHLALVYLLLLLIMFPISFNLVRQFAAVSVAMYATVLLFNGNTKKYVLFTVLASFLHVSALVNIMAFIIYRRINDKSKRSVSTYKLMLSLVIVSAVVVISSYGLEKYGYLFETGNVTANLNFVPRVLMLLIVLSLWYSSRSVYCRYKLFIDLGMACIVLGLVGFFVPYGDRLALYFLPFIILLFPTAVYQFMPSSKKHLTLLATVFLGISYFIFSYYIMGSHAIMPYSSIIGA